VGFSIPSNDVKEALFQILERGRPIRGFLGVQMRDLDPTVRAALGYEDEHGAAILGVSPGSPAEAAGLQPWDVVRSLNDEKIHSATQLFALVQRARVGDAITLDVWRKGQSMKVNATIAESGAAASGRLPSAAATQGHTRDPEEVLKALGIQVRDLSVPERLRGYRGVVVTAIAENGLAAAQVRIGDLVVGVNNSRVTGASDFFQHLAASAAVQDTSLQVVREGQVLRLTLPALSRQE
jgi:serine protease Do